MADYGLTMEELEVAGASIRRPRPPPGPAPAPVVLLPQHDKAVRKNGVSVPDMNVLTAANALLPVFLT